MTVRALAAAFFLLYGALIPVAARGFMAENFVTTMAMTASCCVIAAMLWSRRAVLLNILIAFYVFRVYLTRPYVNIFMPKLQGTPLNYIYNLNYENLQAQDYVRSLSDYYNPADAVVVYLSLLSLLSAWLIGLYAVRPKPAAAAVPPWIFRQVDDIVTGASWPFWLALILLTALNYQPAAATMLNAATGKGGTLFAWGLFSTATVTIACLFAVIKGRTGGGKAPLILLVPVLYSTVIGSAGGSRSAIFSVVVLALNYALFLNWDRTISRRDLPRILISLTLIASITISGALVSQFLRLLLKASTGVGAAWAAISASLRLSNPNNPLPNAVYLALTELLHRASSLKPQFLILNNHWAHNPADTFNLPQTLMRIFNDLVPGEPFRVIGINRLFDYIYYDRVVNYNSENWSVQGLLYLYFGLGFSPVVLFGAACLTARYYQGLAALVEASPAFAAFFILLLNGFMEFGTFERAIPVDVVRPLTSFLAVIVLVKIFRAAAAAVSKKHALA